MVTEEAPWTLSGMIVVLIRKTNLKNEINLIKFFSYKKGAVILTAPFFIAMAL